jgi:hypothetical protein
VEGCSRRGEAYTNTSCSVETLHKTGNRQASGAEGSGNWMTGEVVWRQQTKQGSHHTLQG